MSWLMEVVGSSAVICVLGFLQFVGLASAWLARVSEGSKGQRACQYLFFGCLTLIGLSTILLLHRSSGAWFLSGVNLSVMVLAATWELKPVSPNTVG